MFQMRQLIFERPHINMQIPEFKYNFNDKIKTWTNSIIPYLL